MISDELKKVLTYRNRASVVSKKQHLIDEVISLTYQLDKSCCIAERCWLISNDQFTKPKCENNREKKWVDSSIGYSMCGRSDTCMCYEQTRSKNIKSGHQNRSVAQIEESTKKRKSTVKNRYGVDFVIQNPTILKNRESTCMERYGYTTNLLSQENRVKYLQTLQKKYGVDSPLRSTTILNKVKLTHMERYGGMGFSLRDKFESAMEEKYGLNMPFNIMTL